jgi:hypothetical protein
MSPKKSVWVFCTACREWVPREAASQVLVGHIGTVPRQPGWSLDVSGPTRTRERECHPGRRGQQTGTPGSIWLLFSPSLMKWALSQPELLERPGAVGRVRLLTWYQTRLA